MVKIGVEVEVVAFSLPRLDRSIMELELSLFDLMILVFDLGVITVDTGFFTLDIVTYLFVESARVENV